MRYVVTGDGHPLPARGRHGAVDEAVVREKGCLDLVAFGGRYGSRKALSRCKNQRQTCRFSTFGLDHKINEFDDALANITEKAFFTVKIFAASIAAGYTIEELEHILTPWSKPEEARLRW